MIDAPRRVGIERDGVAINALDWGGNGKAVLFLHPNGFCAGLFEPLARRLHDKFRCVAVDLRGHGASQPHQDHWDLAFATMAADVAAVVDVLGVERLDIVGQSLGGGVGVLVDSLLPGKVRRIVLCEAVAFPASRPSEGPNAMSVAAQRRRAVWPSRDAMRRAYRRKPPLSELGDEALDAYLRWGVLDRPDGAVELACQPRTEAAVFEVSPTGDGAPAAWAHLPHLTADAMVIAGDRSFLPLDFFTAQAAHAGAPFQAVAGGHFFLQEHADRSAGLLDGLLSPD